MSSKEIFNKFFCNIRLKISCNFLKLYYESMLGCTTDSGPRRNNLHLIIRINSESIVFLIELIEIESFVVLLGHAKAIVS